MSSGEKVWPQKYGFKIVGNGPTFISSVEPNSEAAECGLVPGDRLMELDGHDISKLSADVLTILMKETNSHPPAVGIVPSVCHIYLTCDSPQRCGFSVTTKKPITVSHVEPTGIAFAAGLRKGDIILTVNNKLISNFRHKELVLIAENERLVLSIIPTGIRENTNTNEFRGPQIKTSKFLFMKVAKYCNKDYHKKMALVGVLTEYSEDWDIHSLCLSLDSLLKEPTDRKLLKHIEPFIPEHQKDIFKPLLKKKKLYKDCKHLAYIPNKPTQKLKFRILRGDNPYGFVIKGSSPVHVEWLNPGGPADLAGLLPGDFIVAVNELDSRNFNHDQVMKLLQFCGPVPTIDVERYASAISEVGINSSFDSLSNISSTFSVESFNWICSEFSDVTDREGWTFKEKMKYLLTAKERTQLQMDFLQYVNSRNIVKLYHKLEPILDSPSRRTLWQFLLTKMSRSHQEYIHLKENLSETLHDKSTKNLLEYYLNYKEETKMKAALDIYLKNRSFEQVNIIERILNTPAKDELWNSIFPHLMPEHLHIIQKRRDEQKKIFANIHRGIGFKRTSNIYLPPRSQTNWEENDSEEEFRLLGAAADSVHISNDWLPPSLSSEEDSPSVNSTSTLSDAPDSHGHSTHSSLYLSKTPTTFCDYDFPESRSQQRKKGETQSLVLSYSYDDPDQIPHKGNMPQKPKRKNVKTNNRIPNSKHFHGDTQSAYGSNPSLYSQKAPSLPNMYLLSDRGKEFEAKSSMPLYEHQINSKFVQIRKEAKNSQNDPQELSSASKLKAVSTVDITRESYYNQDNDDDSNKNRTIPLQNEKDLEYKITLQSKENSQSKTDKNSPVHNVHDKTLVFTSRNASNGYTELTTFGKIKDKSNLASSKESITHGIPEDKMEDTTQVTRF